MKEKRERKMKRWGRKKVGAEIERRKKGKRRMREKREREVKRERDREKRG